MKHRSGLFGLPWVIWIEGGLLALAAPFLLFPSVVPELTVGALVLLVVSWVVQLTVDRRGLTRTPFHGAMLVWASMVGIGTLVSAFPALTLSKATGLLLGIATWQFLARTVTDRRLLRWALIGLWGFGLLVTAVGVVSVRWPEKVPFVSRWVDVALPSTMVQLPGGPESGVSANQLAGMLVFYLPLPLSHLLAWRFQDGRWVRRLPALFAFGSIGLLTSLTQSRSGWIGSVLGTGLLLVLWGAVLPPSRTRWVLWGICVLGALGMVAGGFAIGPERLQALWEEPQGMTALGNLGTLGFRQEVWRWAVTAVQDFFFTGCGLGTFREVVRLLYPLNVSPSYDIAHAHNIFLQVALDTGIPGLIAYLALLGVASAVGIRVARRDVASRPLALGLLGGLGAFHLYGMLDALAPGSKPALVFWYALGLLSALVRMGDTERGETMDDVSRPGIY